MKKNEKGFTLVELLAVIVVLGIIMVVAGTAVLKTKKDANEKEAVQIEESITKLGSSIYSYEVLSGNKDDENYFYKAYKGINEDESIYISISELKDTGYLTSDKIKNPAGGDDCQGYLEVTRTNEGPEFKGYLSCENLYETPGYDVDKESSSTKLSSSNILYR